MSTEPVSPEDRALLDEARVATAHAYAPYSDFSVGAAVRTIDGRVITAANVESASYPLGICAERAALARAVAEGVRPGEVDAVAITASPCGGCRQWLREFGARRVIFATRGGDLLVRSPDELLSDSFELTEH